MHRRNFVKSSVAALGVRPVLAMSPPARGGSLSGRVDPSPAGREGEGRGTSPQAAGTALVHDPRYLDHVPVRSPEIPERLVRMRAELETRGLIEATVPVAPTVDPLLRIRAHHTGEHVDSVRRLGTTAAVAELAVSGVLAGVDAVAEGRVRNAFCALRPPGHHANNTGAEEGFCYYSNAAIAVRYAQEIHGYGKVLVIDWDYHHGNATQNAFYDDPSVLFFSSHDWHAYPGTGDPSLTGEGEGSGLNINVHLDCGASDADMLRRWDDALSPAVAAFDPDFVIVSAGFDSRRDDLLGCFDLTDDAFRRMTRTAMDYADSCCEGRLVALLEGGYNLDGTALAAAAHVETLLEH